MNKKTLLLTITLMVFLACVAVLMATQTTTFPMDNTVYVPVTVISDHATSVTVYEHAQAGTTDILMKGTLSNTPVRRPAGQRITFLGTYKKNDVAGYVEAASAVTITMDQEEAP